MLKLKVHLRVDFNKDAVKAEKEQSHLHRFMPIADPDGNRAERRRANKLMKKEKK